MANNMHQYYLVLAMFFSSLTLAQDGMSKITGGVYRPLYLSKDSPSVQVETFYLDKTPITNHAYYLFVQKLTQWQKNTIKALLAEKSYLNHWQQSGSESKPLEKDMNKPVVFVSWYGAQAYCQAQNKRLPTVAEWEYVAQASEHYVDGSQDASYHQRILDWYAKAAELPLQGVGSDTPNVWGVHNMHGLIWEWTEDFNSELITGESRNDSSVNKELYCASGTAGAVNPSDYAAFMRYGFRSSLSAKFTLGSLGFRCAQDAD